MIMVHALSLALPMDRVGPVGEAVTQLDCDWRAEGTSQRRSAVWVNVEVSSRLGLSRAQLDMLLAVADPEGAPKAAGPKCRKCGQPIVDDDWAAHPVGAVGEVPTVGLWHRVCPVSGVQVTS